MRRSTVPETFRIEGVEAKRERHHSQELMAAEGFDCVMCIALESEDCGMTYDSR